MFPAEMPLTDPDELLRCRDSSPFSEPGPQDRDENRPADTDLAHEVDNALWKEPILRALEHHSIEIRVRNGVVSLYGHVVSQANRQQAEHAIRSVGGIAGVRNHLIADDRLLAEVAAALGSLGHTYGCTLFTGVSHGVVLLSGTVDDQETRALAEQCAAGNPNVRGVINSVQVRRGSPDLPDVPFLQPCVGAEFFFLDGISGRVRQVIINPDNRRVAAMTLQGRFEDRWQEPNSSGKDSTRPPERTLVIPMRAVRYLTTHSGFLNIRSTQGNQYSESNSADFHVPPADWKPPYPYCSADVLWPTKPAEAPIQIPEQAESSISLALAHQVLKDELLENDSLGG